MKLSYEYQTYLLRQSFSISRGSRTHASVVEVRVTQNGVTGRGECVPYARYGENPESVTGQLQSVIMPVSRHSLQDQLPPGAARNALDCALWDLEAKSSGQPVWQLAGLAEPRPVHTAFTLSLDCPQAMHAEARANRHRPLLKVKLGGPKDHERIQAVRSGAPDSRLVVDANEGWNTSQFPGLMQQLEAAGVTLVEQPFPEGNDDALETLPHRIPVCADESCHDRRTLRNLVGKYEFVNIKLDKAGGLTEALKLLDAAKRKGFGIMVGCMIGSSLGVAPAVFLAQEADYVDLDPPLLLAEDQRHALDYLGSELLPPSPQLWG